MIGDVISHYQILEKLGNGGMGVVYKARDTNLGRIVALKFLPKALLGDEQALARFRREAQAASALNHPNICTVYEIGEAEGTAFIALEYLEGSSLMELISGRPLKNETVLSVGIEIADALATAHRAGIVHRDIKPGNIFITTRGCAKVLDFGIAKFLAHSDASTVTLKTSGHLTTDGTALGTVAYMSPEQICAKDLDARTDLFSLGTVLYEISTGWRPFQGRTDGEISGAILYQPPPPPAHLNPSLPTRLQDIILRALEKDRELRFQRASDMVVELQRLRRDLEQGTSAFTPSSTSAAVSGGAPSTAPSVFSPEPMTPGVASAHAAPSGSGAHTASTRPRRARWIAAGWVAVFVAAALAGYLAWKNAQTRAAPPLPASIAVLPFMDMSPDQDQAVFGDGLTVELIHQLSHLPGLKVIGRSSAFQFKGRNEDLRAVGQKLQVTHVLEGSIQRQGDRVRVQAELVKTDDGFQVWSQTYDRKLNDIFDVQDEIARAVSSALQLKLLGGSAAAASRRAPTPEAYKAFLQAQYFAAQGEKEDSEKALTYADQAIRLDPNYAPAFALRSDLLSNFAESSWMDSTEAYRRARADAERAVALGPNHSAGYSALARVQIGYEWDAGGAEASLNKAVALEPGNAIVWRDRASLAATLGRMSDAVAWQKQAIELDPLRAPSYAWLGTYLDAEGHYPEADAAVRKALELSDQYPGGHFLRCQILLHQNQPTEALAEIQQEPVEEWRLPGLAIAYHALGRKPDSQAALDKLMANYGTTAAYQVAEAYAYRGETAKALDWLERALQQRDPGLTSIKFDPLLNSVRHDPRYRELLQKLHLPE